MFYAYGNGADLALAYTRVYGVGVAVVPEEDSPAKDCLREIGWQLIEARSVADYWRAVEGLDDPLILANKPLVGFPRKCHALIEGGECPATGSPVVVMAVNDRGVISTPYKHFMEVLGGN